MTTQEALAALPCGHHESLRVTSAETGELLYCELCNCRSERRDALQMEALYKAERDQLSAQLATIRAALEDSGRDAERYRWLRSEEVATDLRYFEFWQEFNIKLCREGKMDALIDAARAAEGG